MSAKSKSSVQNKQDYASQFVNYELTKEEQAACKKWEFGVEDYFNILDKLLDADYKVSFSQDTYNRCFAAFLTPTKDNKINPGMILSGRGSTPMKAFKQLIYKHFHIFDEQWSEFVGARQLTIDD